LRIDEVLSQRSLGNGKACFPEFRLMEYRERKRAGHEHSEGKGRAERMSPIESVRPYPHQPDWGQQQYLRAHHQGCECGDWNPPPARRKAPQAKQQVVRGFVTH
jgi:hypothetical protein